MVFVEKDSFRNLRRLPTDAFRSIPRLPRETLPVAASDLVAWYPFRSGTGEDITAGDSRFGDTTDYSAVVNGATFKPSGGVTDIQTGPNSGAFDFDGTDDTLDLGTVADSDQSFTVMAWVEPDTPASGDKERILTKADPTQFRDGSFLVDILEDGRVRFGVNNNGSGSVVESSSSVGSGTYGHVVGRYDFIAGSSTLFLNGQPVGSASPGQLPALSSQAFAIGGHVPLSATNAFLDGAVDGIRIYQATLSDSQINQIYLNTEP